MPLGCRSYVPRAKAILTAFSVVFLFDVLQLAAGASTQLTDAGVFVSVGAADGRRTDGVAELVAARRADTVRPATVGRR